MREEAEKRESDSHSSGQKEKEEKKREKRNEKREQEGKRRGSQKERGEDCQSQTVSRHTHVRGDGPAEGREERERNEGEINIFRQNIEWKETKTKTKKEKAHLLLLFNFSLSLPLEDGLVCGLSPRHFLLLYVPREVFVCTH